MSDTSDRIVFDLRGPDAPGAGTGANTPEAFKEGLKGLDRDASTYLATACSQDMPGPGPDDDCYYQETLERLTDGRYFLEQRGNADSEFAVITSEGYRHPGITFQIMTEAQAIDFLTRADIVHKDNEEVEKLQAERTADERPRHTPMMEQYLGIKKQHLDDVLLYRMGDFYEAFYEDAKQVSQILDITLTTNQASANAPIPMCGIPAHGLDTYVPKLTAHGLTVAICEQVQDQALPPTDRPRSVGREVVRIVRPDARAKEDGLGR